MNAQEVVFRKYEQLKSIRAKIESIWRQVQKYCMAGIKPYVKDTAETKPDVYDSTAYRASAILASGLYSQLTNPATKWFEFGVGSSASYKLKNYIYGLAETTRDVLYRHGFYNAVAKLYSDLVHYGIGCLYEEMDLRYGFRFTSVNPLSFVYETDMFDRLTDVFVEFELTPDEAIERFGPTTPDTVKKKAENGSVDKVKFVSHTFYSGDDVFPVYSVYYHLDTKQIVDTVKYKSFPYFVISWNKPTGFMYGASPSINALPDVKMLNGVVKTVYDGAELAVNPAYSLPYDGYLEPITLEPGGLNYRLTNDPKDVMIPITNAANIPVGIDIIQMLMNKINEQYFVDLFLMLQDKTMTATEVIQRAQEKMMLLGSVVGRINHDFLTPLLKRTVQLIWEYNLYPPLQDFDLTDIQYLSPLQQALKSSEYASIVQLLNTALTIAQYDPTVFDNINSDELIRHVGKIYSVPPMLFRSQDETQQIRQQRAQSQAQMEQLQAELIATKAEKQKASAQRDAVKATLGK